MFTLTLKQGDIEPDVEITVTDETGAAVDVTGYDIKWAMWNARQPSAVALSGAAGEIVDGPLGKIAYRWAAGNTDVSGTYEGEFLITPPLGLGDPMHCPTVGKVVIIIEPKVG